MPGENGEVAEEHAVAGDGGARAARLSAPRAPRSPSRRVNGDRAATAASPRRHHESEPSADDFAAERMLRTPARRPDSGWRLALFRLSGGHVRVAPSAAELRQRELVARVKTPDPRLPQDRVHLAQGRRRQDEHLPPRRPHLRVPPRRPRDRARRQPGRRDARPSRPPRDDGDRDVASRRRGRDRAVRGHPRLHVAVADAARGRRGGRRPADHAGDRRGRVQAGDPPARAALQPRLPRHRDGRARIGDARDSRRRPIRSSSSSPRASTARGPRARRSTGSRRTATGTSSTARSASSTASARTTASSISTGSRRTSPGAAARPCASRGTRISRPAPRPSSRSFGPTPVRPIWSSPPPIATGFADPPGRRS